MAMSDKSPKPDAAEVDNAEREATAIAREIAAELGPERNELKQSVAVTPAKGGMLISLTERESFEMFDTGSAKPKSEAIRLMEAIARVVQSRKGRIVIRGHTDSRPYRNKFYDNWQLSTARAHFARYMLVRGGLGEARIHKVEGVADREPRNPLDPQAAENRRIEILLESQEP
jgi:chemotaxis protein MotB